MTVKTIRVSYERRFNIGDFNSVNLEATMTADLDEGEDAEACFVECQGKVKAAVAREYVELRKKLDAQKAKGVAVAEKVQLAQ